MPRQSAEARGAAAFRAGAAPPAAPKTLSKDAAAIWTDVVASKPVDWFDAGARILLENYCETAVQARALAKRMVSLRKAAAWEEMRVWEKRLALLNRTLVTLATKLRLSVQANVEWEARKNGERGIPAKARDPLLGGAAVWGDHSKPN